jgi:prefoldin subunit 5
VLVRIYNEQDSLIRTLKWKADTGFNRQWWGMEERGFRPPNAPKPKGDAPEPGGLQALPGTYKVVLQLGTATDSITVTIKDDPRLQKTDAVKAAQRTQLARLRQSSDKLLQATDRLAESEETLAKVKTTLGDTEGPAFDSLRRRITALTDSIKALRENIAGKTVEKQGLVHLPELTPVSALQQAQYYILGKSITPGAQEETLVRNAETLVAKAVQQVNQFYANTWKAFRRQTESTPLSPFKEYSPIQ